MKSLREAILMLLLILLFYPACSMQTKKIPAIGTNGFLNNDCYQAILTFDPDDGAYGLVAKRDSAFFKAKQADLTGMAIEKMVYSLLANEPRFRFNEKFKRETTFTDFPGFAVTKLRNLVKNGSIAFAYYNEKNSIILGYQISNPDLREKATTLIDSLAAKSELHDSNPERQYEKK